ncbi:Hypothetical protein SMAX5B_016464, partial [Scophthalmus maximus]
EAALRGVGEAEENPRGEGGESGMPAAWIGVVGSNVNVSSEGLRRERFFFKLHQWVNRENQF